MKLIETFKMYYSPITYYVNKQTKQKNTHTHEIWAKAIMVHTCRGIVSIFIMEP